MTINIHPAEAQSDDWGGVEQALVQDLRDSSLYQTFSARNSAYIPQPTPATAETSSTPEVVNASEDTSSETGTSVDQSDASGIDDADVESVSDNETNTSTDTSTEETETNTPSTDDTQQSESAGQTDAGDETNELDVTEEENGTVEEETAPDASEPSEATSFESASVGGVGEYVRSVFSRAVGLFPLANTSTTTPKKVDIDEGTATDSPRTSDNEDSDNFDSLPEGDIANEPVDSSSGETGTSSTENTDTRAPSSTDSTVSNDAEIAPLTSSSATEQKSDTTQNDTPEASPAQSNTSASPTSDAIASSSTSSTATTSLAPAATPSTDQQYEMTLSDFATPPLEPGQFVTGMQLRMSLGAQMQKSIDPDSMSYVEVFFGNATNSRPVGKVMLDEEVSNAINGGYYLFALPEISDVEELEDAQVTIRYVGEREGLDGLFVDAAWLELKTKIVTEDDIKARGLAKNLKHLDTAEYTTLMSTQLNFRQDETPLFNLKYVPQRNAVVRGVRSLFGNDVVDIENAAVRHRSFGLLGIEPIVTVTKEGLITIELPEESKEKMRPGEYQIELTMSEGGKEVVETFDFQWGILTLNPNKSEYESGEPVDISIGALTPNGHTICQANLDLYITDPNGAIERVAVNESGQCDGNNVIDVPDFSAQSVAGMPGEHTVYLERLDESGDVIGFTTDSFLVTAKQRLSIEREGPTRIYPPAPYPMTLTIDAVDAFTGVLTERVPKDFAISSTSADIRVSGEWKVLTWDIDMLGETTKTVSYQFDAPDISPYLFRLGPAELRADQSAPTVETASSSASSSPATEPQAYFAEHREWQIASDAIGNMLLFWDGGGAVPAGWSCVSCTTGDPFFERFIRGGATYGSTGGSATHGHTADGVVFTSTNAAATESGGGPVAPAGHSHTYTPTIGTASNLPEYRQLRVIRYDAAAGEPTTIPAGAIAIFDVASSSLPLGWNRYTAQDGRYIYGANTPVTTGGANTHNHTISGATDPSTGAGTRSRGGGGTGASDTHTHSVNGNSGTLDHQPPYIEVVLAELSADAAPVNGIIAMWDEEVDDGWLDLSQVSGDPFFERFIKPATSYGATGGAVTHAHADVSGLVSGAPIGTTNARLTGTAGSNDTHTHPVDVTNFSSESNLPPYISVVFGKRQGTDPVYTQRSSRWYSNENAQTPTDPWPSDAVQTLDLGERESISATSTPVKNGEQVRLRLNGEISNATSTIGSAFKLQYSEASVCSAATTWLDVGGISSSSPWRGYNNTSVSDSSTLSSILLGSSTVAQTYEEDGYSSSTPNAAAVGDVSEWDFVLEHNDATAGADYCFRLVEADGTAFATYSHYPQLLTNGAPGDISVEDPFDNEKTASTTPNFTFVAVDPEGENIDYAIEVDDDPQFGSPLISRDTINDDQLFENQVLISDKAPFQSGELIQFSPTTNLSNNTTYYWRVRGQDPEGSDQWGEWSTVRSVTIDTALTASAWFQNEDAQFETNIQTGVEAGGDSVSLVTGSTTGVMISTPIRFTDAALGTAWDSLNIVEADTNNVLDYQIEYYDDGTDAWALIPDTDLSGNNAGFSGATAINLLGLDVDEYSVLRLRAEFTDSAGGPNMLSWEVQWGYRVETPAITKLFPNEQVGTTTPTFEFTTTDPQDDSLTYQIEWAATPDFSTPTTRTSDTDAGFVNSDTGADTDPFISGDTVHFTVQSSDTLTGSSTYWWRVRAKDTTGDNAYSFWTDPQSFTVIEGTEVSTWYQTTEEQFSSDILSGTVALATDGLTVATTAQEALLVYGEGTNNTPRFRQWNGSSWGAEDDLLSIDATVRWVLAEEAPTREEYIALTIGTDSHVNAQVFRTGVWGDLQEMTTSMGNSQARGAALAYESLSGDAVAVYCDGDPNPSYRIWNGTSWSAEAALNVASANNCAWIEMAADPTSDEIAIVVRDDAGSQYEAFVWDGAAWGNTSVFGEARDSTFSGIALEYEASGGQAVAVAPSPGGGPNRMVYNTWNGTTWSGETTQTIDGRLYWADLARNEGTDDMVLCYINDNTDVQAIRWDGGGFVGDFEFTATANSITDPGYSCLYETTSGRANYILGAYSDTAQSNYRTWSGTTWSGAAQINAIGDAATMQLSRTGVGTILGVFYDSPSDALRFSSWDGTTWSTTETLESDMPISAAPYGSPYAIAPRGPGSEGTVVVAPPIEFEDGVGPYWESYSWNDTTPGTSEIRYYLQYLTATSSWAFIPATDLTDNDIGTTSGPFDLSNLDISTYGTIRPYAELVCSGADCPTLDDWRVEWAGGITISGTIQEYNQTTNVTAGTVAVAVNGELQTGKTAAVSGAGTWSIDNVTVFPGDIVTTFVSSAADTNEAVGVARYDGQGDMDGIVLYERHVSLGSNDATTTPFTNSDIAAYTFTNTEDIFFAGNGSNIDFCVEAGCADVRLVINDGETYQPNGSFTTHDIQIDGRFTGGTETFQVDGSWDNNGTTTLANATIVFTATAGTETIDSTAAAVASFGNVVFGTTTGNATWTLSSPLDVDGDLTVDRGTLARADTAITVAGNLVTNANGVWSGIGSTTFDGSIARTWEDQNTLSQNIGRVVVEGSAKIITLASDVAAESVTIGPNDTLDASVSNHDLTVYGDWNNQNSFLARSGTVIFAATSTGRTITTSGDPFANLRFAGAGGTWSFTEPALSVTSDFRIATGTVTLPTATTTVSGSFDATGGAFAHNNGTLLFDSDGTETITFAGTSFTNVAHNLSFNGSGSWTIADQNATTTNDILIEQGTVNFPNGTLAIGGTLGNTGGAFSGGTGTTRFYSSASEVITTDGSSFGSVVFDGTGDWSFADSFVDVNADMSVVSGTVTTPNDTLTIGGSYVNAATVNAPAGVVLFDSSSTGETIDFGASALFAVHFASAAGGWSIIADATTTDALRILEAGDWTLASGNTLSVGGDFENTVGGASTTWAGSTLSLSGNAFSINNKTDAGDAYENLRLANDSDVSMWNSVAATYDIDTTTSLYSQDHNAVNGDLYIFGAYERTSGVEYWNYATDFDGTDLASTSEERQVDVRLAADTTVTIASSTLEIIGGTTATTTIAHQGAGTYTASVLSGTTTAQYYAFADLGSTGLSLLGGSIVSSLRDGSFTVAEPNGSALTLASTTIDANPAKQIFNVSFSTTSAINATNVTQIDGTPASYWWFRNGAGNLYGEAFDIDTGDPGSVRFDDSSLVLTLSGTVYSDAGVTPITGGTCDGTTPVVDVLVNGALATSTSCSAVDGSYTAPGIVVIGDPTITVYLNDAAGGEQGSAITRTPTADITDLDIYANRVIVRNEDTEPLRIENLATYDSADDADLRFTAATSTSGDTLQVLAGNELYTWASSTFAPNGVVTLHADSAANGYDGTLYIDDAASFNVFSTSTLTIGGRLELGTNAALNAASSTVRFTATTTGKSLTAPGTISFYDLLFSGNGGSWNLGADILVDGDMIIDNGTVTGTGDITVQNGALTGDGILSLGGGTTTIAAGGDLGGNTAWTFSNLQLGDTVQVGTTTPLGTATTTVAGRLTIAAAHYLDAGATSWDLSGSGTVFVENGTFIEDTSTIRYSGNGANVLTTQYYNLDINAGAGTPTYTGTGLGLIVENDLTIGGDAPSTFDLDAVDPQLDVNGDVYIRSNGSLLASNANPLEIAGNYTNEGSFTGNAGTVIFDGTGVSAIAAGASSFGTVEIAAAGDVSVTEHATATDVFHLQDANSFTLESGQTLAVAGNFFNSMDGTNTTWTGSTLRLYGDDNYSVNTATSSDTYDTIDIDGSTQVRIWNSDAVSYDVAPLASLYSQDHAGVDGDLYIWGTYTQTTQNDHWSYATDFDGSDLTGGNERAVDVYFASDAVLDIAGGSLTVYGDENASTTVQSQGTGTYSVQLGGFASTSWQYYTIRDIDSDGLVLTGSPTVDTLSFGDLAVSVDGGTGMTVAGSVISANPAKNFTRNRFALNGGATSGFNVIATGTSVSSWRFTNHYGDIDGEANDVDPDGDPGYIAWDDSAALITISGRVYQDDTSSVSTVCGVSSNIRLWVAGLSTVSTTCDASTGQYSFTNVSYSSGDSLIVYIDGETTEGAVVTKEPVSNIGNLDLFENHVIVRHESVNPIAIADMAVWDSSDDADIPFTAVDGGTDTLTLPADRKLLVWNGKEFAPDGDITLTAGGVESYGGALELQENADFTGQGTETLSIGGDFLLDTGAVYTASNGTTTFTANAARTITVNESNFTHIEFTGTGSWTVTDTTLTVNGDYLQTAGSVDLPSGTSTFAGSFTNVGGSFVANDTNARFTGSGTHDLTLGGSPLADMLFLGGNYVFGDTSATSTGTITIAAGDLTLPNGALAVGGDFLNATGTVTHNSGEIVFTSSSTATLLASSSDLSSVRYVGGGAYTIQDENLTLIDSFSIDAGAVTLASGTLSIGGSFSATGGTFDHASGTILFNSADTGETIHPGSNPFANVQFSAPAGGYTFIGNATTTGDFVLANVGNFVVQNGVDIYVGGVFLNNANGANTDWSGSTLTLAGESHATINSKTSTGDQYDALVIAPDTDIRAWNSAATTTTVASSASLYSQDHAGTDGALHIYGNFQIDTLTEAWSYATDFDLSDLSGGNERPVTVSHASGSRTRVVGGTLRIEGENSNETVVTNQGIGTYSLTVDAGTLAADWYRVRNLDANGLSLNGTSTISSLANGDFELAFDGGTLISLSSTTLNANASLVVPATRFATTTSISGTNVTLNGSTSNAWTFTGHTGNLDGEDYDVDGPSDCGSLRWDDSSCLLIQQTDVRWRNDDGGLGVPASEWYDVNWDARQQVRVVNDDTTAYTDAAVKLLVPYDADMQSDWDDLRFTDDSGTSLISHWVASTTANTLAEVWVKIPTMTAEDTTTLYMYYNNPSAPSVSSSTAVFTAADDFEDANLAEYSGETGEFTVDGSFAYDGVNGLIASDVFGRTNAGGIYRLDQTVSTGETIRFTQYLDVSEADETCTTFGVQSTGAPSDNYGLCIDLNGTDRLVLVRDAVDSAGTSPAVTLDAANITVTDGWYTFEIDWAVGNIAAAMTDDTGATITTLSSNDSTYTTGGYGFTYWFQHGAWDSFTVRPTLVTEPAYFFGVEQSDGGATWKAAQNEAGIYDANDIARLRVAVENSGLAVTNQEFQLEYAPLDTAPSCEAVNTAEYEVVPVQATCGTSPLCMQASSFVTNGAATGDLLTGASGAFVPGEIREDPSNITSSLDIDQNQYTELEYVMTPTTNVVDEDLCIRVTNNGSELDTYLEIAQLSLRFDPVVTTATLNDGQPINLLPGTTTQVFATSTVTDLNGSSDLTFATSTIYRSGVSGGAACTPDNNNCYVSSTGDTCRFADCVGNSCTVECRADVFFHADPTDLGSANEGEEWLAFIEVEDASGGYDFASAPGVELNTLRAIDVNGEIDYGMLSVNDDTGAFNASTSVFNLGNVEADLEVTGSDLSDGVSSVIPASEQKFSTSTFTYASCGATCELLSSTTPVQIDIELTKPAAETPPVSDNVYWGIRVPIGVNSVPHTGINVFTPVSP